MLDIFSTIENETVSTGAMKHVQVGSFSFPIHNSVLEVADLLDSAKHVHWVSRAEWSAIDLLLSILAKHDLAPTIYMSTYAFSEKPARVLANLLDEGKISLLYCVIDSRVDVRSQSALQLIKGCATKLVMADTHAKVTTIIYPEHRYTIVGSANYTSNKRIEAGIVSTCAEVSMFHYKWIADELNKGMDD